MASDAPATNSARGTSQVLGSRRKFTYNAAATELVTDGYMSLRDAQTVLTDTLSKWGVTGQRDSDIDPVVAKIAHALRQGTSAERDFSKVWFEHGGVHFGLEELRIAAGTKDASENPVRVWARSYNRGEVAVRLHDALKDPANTEMRESAALDYECSLDYVHVSFDFADSLVNYHGMKLTQMERYTIKANTMNKVRASRSAHIGGIDGGTIQDFGSNAAATDGPVVGHAAGSGAGIVPASASRRTGFAPVR